jgi:hypothetical protein
MIGKMYCPLVTLSPFRQAERVVAAPWGGRGGLRVGAYLSSAERMSYCLRVVKEEVEEPRQEE